MSCADFNNPNELDDEDDSDDDDEKEDEADADDEDEDDYADNDTPSTSSPSSTENPYMSATPDPYLTNFDPENEREEFLAAKERMEKHHEDRVSKVILPSSQNFTLSSFCETFNHVNFVPGHERLGRDGRKVPGYQNRRS